MATLYVTHVESNFFQDITMTNIPASLLFSAVIVAGCSRLGELPTIQNSAQLVADCHNLAVSRGDESIPENKWPESIKQLGPLEVKAADGGLQITTFAQTGVGMRGYIVANIQPSNSDHFTFSGTPYRGIYRFDFIP